LKNGKSEKYCTSNYIPRDDTISRLYEIINKSDQFVSFQHQGSRETRTRLLPARETRLLPARETHLLPARLLACIIKPERAHVAFLLTPPKHLKPPQ
jgi:hypothetical protein